MTFEVLFLLKIFSLNGALERRVGFERKTVESYIFSIPAI